MTRSNVLVGVLVVLLVAAIAYVYTLQSKSATERQELETALHEETQRLNTLKKQITEQERAVVALKAEFLERSGDVTRLKDAVVSRDHELVKIHNDLVQRDQELVSLRKTFAQRSEMLGVLNSPNVKVILLSGSHRASTARGFVLYDSHIRKGLLYAFNLPRPPLGKTYHLWAILDKPVSAGAFSVDAGSKSRFLIKGAPSWTRVSKFAVTLEREGSRPKLSGDLYLGVGL
jgi:anti-sigma-K factor RskA